MWMAPGAAIFLPGVSSIYHPRRYLAHRVSARAGDSTPHELALSPLCALYHRISLCPSRLLIPRQAQH
jgi:hypothetical protein